jgi:hypothetical protein
MALQLVVVCALQVEELTSTRVLQVGQLPTTYVLQAGTVQPPLGTILGTTHIHLTHLVGVKGKAESQVLWCNAHNVRVGVRMVKLVALQLMQLVSTRSAARGPIN